MEGTMTTTTVSPWPDLEKIRTQSPLVHNITNYVVMNITANALLAAGASPVMAHAIEEVEDLAGIAGALVLNIGTLSGPWIEAMVKAGQTANRKKVPVVLDPVGSGATVYRTATTHMLIRETHPAVIRGNASEIRSLLHSGSTTKGVDSTHAPEEVWKDATALSHTHNCVVVISGPTDIVVKGDEVFRIKNGHPLMPRVTGMGCAATALIGAFLTVNSSPLYASAHAMAMMGIAGEMAAERSPGPGSFVSHFLDALFLMRESDIATRLKWE
jgi:hydroxyethylthiazole kinase